MSSPSERLLHTPTSTTTCGINTKALEQMDDVSSLNHLPPILSPSPRPLPLPVTHYAIPEVDDDTESEMSLDFIPPFIDEKYNDSLDSHLYV